MNIDITLNRDDLTARTSEPWKPPVFSPPKTRLARLAALARRSLDLQAASVWYDLSTLLAHAEGTVLDVGCGAQPYRGLFPPSVHYTAIDTADAWAHFGYRMPDTLIIEGDVWPVDDASVDLVLSTETLEHVPDPSQFLSEARRVLRPGGHLILTVPFAARWHYIPHDYWRFTPSGLVTLLSPRGFEKIAVYARGNALTVACYKVMALILPLVMGRAASPVVTVFHRLLGLALSPVLLLLAALARCSLRSRGGNDCLGYTVVAKAAGKLTP